MNSRDSAEISNNAAILKKKTEETESKSAQLRENSLDFKKEARKLTAHLKNQRIISESHWKNLNTNLTNAAAHFNEDKTHDHLDKYIKALNAASEYVIAKLSEVYAVYDPHGKTQNRQDIIKEHEDKIEQAATELNLHTKETSPSFILPVRIETRIAEIKAAIPSQQPQPALNSTVTEHSQQAPITGQQHQSLEQPLLPSEAGKKRSWASFFCCCSSKQPAGNEPAAEQRQYNSYN